MTRRHKAPPSSLALLPPREKAVASRRLDLAVQYRCDREMLPRRPQFFRWARAALQGGGQVAIRLASAEEARALNREYRGKDCATNVLSFPYDAKPRVCGDLVICPEVVAREAIAQHKTLEFHYAHLVVHGMLHLQGWDHENDADAVRMEQREREILSILGYPDPYA
jgi:probable rRNA maturation factor